MAREPMETALVAELNDLLRLDHDAIAAYTVAIERLEEPSYRAVLLGFREDHERHVRDLERLVADYHGRPAAGPHVATGFFKRALQTLGALGGDREILLAFRVNERQVKERYERAAAGARPPHVTQVLTRNAEDEARHYRWAERLLEGLGYGGSTVAGGVARVAERIQGAGLDAIEALGRELSEEREKERRRGR